MIRISFLVETVLTHRLFASHVRKVLRKAARTVRLTNAEVAVIAVDDSKIKKLNTTYRRKRKTTDVLSFAMREGTTFPHVSSRREQLGDIYINWDEVVRRAKKMQTQEKDIFSFLAVHGFLHLAGFDHQSSNDMKRMRRLERSICEGNVYYEQE